MSEMTPPRLKRPVRKASGRYHHGDLRRALIQEAVHTIQVKGVDAVTLRAVGHTLGVSRTALYRHFADKSALLAAVAGDGFRTFRLQLVEAWEKGGRDVEAFEAMGAAYVRFAIANPSHYRVMFGGFVRDGATDPELAEECAAALQALVDALVALQQKELARRDEPLLVARFIWAAMHGIAMLAIDGQLGSQPAEIEQLIRYSLTRLRVGIAA
jgi:AcrR family transcriptional regulator